VDTPRERVLWSLEICEEVKAHPPTRLFALIFSTLIPPLQASEAIYFEVVNGMQQPCSSINASSGHPIPSPERVGRYFPGDAQCDMRAVFLSPTYLLPNTRDSVLDLLKPTLTSRDSISLKPSSDAYSQASELLQGYFKLRDFEERPSFTNKADDSAVLHARN